MAKPVAGFNANPQNINTNGRPPKGYSITETFREMLSAQPDIKRALAIKVINAASKGDLAAIKLLWQYMDGMPPQNQTLTITDVSKVVEKLESDYGEFRQDTMEQAVAANPPVQDQGQTGAVSDLPAQPDAAETPK